MELCACPQCGLPAEVVGSADDVFGAPGTSVGAVSSRSELVGVRCIGRHWFFGLRDRLIGDTAA